jgi:hypothetical protein
MGALRLQRAPFFLYPHTNLIALTYPHTPAYLSLPVLCACHWSCRLYHRVGCPLGATLRAVRLLFGLDLRW